MGYSTTFEKLFIINFNYAGIHYSMLYFALNY